MNLHRLPPPFFLSIRSSANLRSKQKQSRGYFLFDQSTNWNTNIIYIFFSYINRMAINIFFWIKYWLKLFLQKSMEKEWVWIIYHKALYII